jgi:aryl-alcohol dehydrogenase-like predicted oxidoreductase
VYRSLWHGFWPRSRGSCLFRQRKLHGLEENVGAAETELSTDELTEIEDAASKIQVQGGHYSEAAERMTNL